MTDPAEHPEAPSLPFLIAALEHSEPIMRSNAAKELGRRGPEAAPALAALTAALHDPDPMVSALAANAIGKIGQTPDAATQDRFLQMLESAPYPIRFWVADAIERLELDTEATRAALTRVAADPHPMAKAVRAVARRTLQRFGAPVPPDGPLGG